VAKYQKVKIAFKYGHFGFPLATEGVNKKWKILPNLQKSFPKISFLGKQQYFSEKLYTFFKMWVSNIAPSIPTSSTEMVQTFQ